MLRCIVVKPIKFAKKKKKKKKKKGTIQYGTVLEAMVEAGIPVRGQAVGSHAM